MSCGPSSTTGSGIGKTLKSRRRCGAMYCEVVPERSNRGCPTGIGRALHIPVGFDTDVNAAALGEWRWGAGKGLDAFIYLTIGTGIGGGGISNGRLMHGLLHPEMGHIRLPHDQQADPFAGICPYHGDCLEGVACGPAMQARWGLPARDLSPSHPGWALEAHYLSLSLVNLTLALSPRRILLGGGVMQQSHLFDLIRADFASLLNGYIRHPDVIDRSDKYIMPPQLGSRAGVLGSLILAEDASLHNREHGRLQDETGLI